MVSTINEDLKFFIAQMTEHDLLEVVEIEEASGLSRWGWEAYHAELAQGRGSIMLVARISNGEDSSTGQTVKDFIAARIVASGIELLGWYVPRSHFKISHPGS